jgi:hypothetical protein
MLRKLFACYNMSDSTDLCFWAVLMIVFFGMLRKSSLLLKYSNSLTESGICHFDVTEMTEESLMLVVRQSKTNQFGRRVHRIPFVACSENILCPVKAMLSHLVASKLLSVSNLFAFVRSGRSIILNHADFVSKLRLGLGVIGLNPNQFSAHSMRMGGCTMGSAAGLSVLDLKLRGDWKSDAIEQYLFVPGAQVVSAARIMSDFAAQLE